MFLFFSLNVKYVKYPFLMLTNRHIFIIIDTSVVLAIFFVVANVERVIALNSVSTLRYDIGLIDVVLLYLKQKCFCIVPHMLMVYLYF